MGRPSKQVLQERMDHMLDRLRQDIMTGRLKSGDYIPSEVALGRQFGISKESVRRALNDLVDEGVLRKIRRVGNQVTEEAGGLFIHQKQPSHHHTMEHPLEEADAVLPAASRDQTVLRLAYYPGLEQEASLSMLIEAFERKHPGVKVELLKTTLPLEYARHHMADVFTVSVWDHWKQQQVDPRMKIMGDPPYMEAYPKLKEPFVSRDGRVTALPLIFSPVVLCYNTTHFAAANIPAPDEHWTWYTLLKHARTLSRELNVRGFASHIQSLNRWPVFLLQNGFRFGDQPNGRIADSPDLWESLRISRELLYGQQQHRTAPLLSENDHDIERWFREGKVSMIMNTYFGMNSLRNSSMSYGAAPLPSLHTDRTLLLVTGIACSSASRHPELARQLAAYLCGEEAQTLIRQHTVSLPALPSAWTPVQPLLGSRPIGGMEPEEIWRRGHFYSDLDLLPQVIEDMREQLKGFWSNMEDEIEAGERLTELLKSYR
ncbi:extracellular solute-binding protein [Paenibacillus lemnae]|uniref:Extracellular solute-binding protein n=1 Tax=Paenibacillus lemnae TaxID=1330551 RepID=A0A848M6E1_PAELE|nr:extracellular solute-binding protein [Paenibacillus lemnae]NMO96728.1 extracellular solute-binding protein [Paenibacillus lemnae]